jgi:hypothetical protein
VFFQRAFLYGKKQMPSDKNNKPVTDNNSSADDFPVVHDNEDLPPMIHNDLQPGSSTSSTTSFSDINDDSPATASSGSSSPNDDIMPPVITASQPSKKYGGGRGKFIATILGLILLVGGATAGFILVRQNQNIGEKAGGTECGGIYGSCPGGFVCQAGNCVPTTATECDPGAQSGCVTDGCAGTKTCTSSSQWGSCVKNNSSCGSDDPTPRPIDCGGVRPGDACTTGQDCHCQQGDVCSTKICEPDQHDSCIAQGRNWCDNMQAGDGKTCCAAGYVCSTAANGGCVRPVTPPPDGTVCQALYYCNITNNTCQLTANPYNPTSHIQCDGTRTNTCEQNLQIYVPNTVTPGASCYTTLAACNSICAVRTASPTPTPTRSPSPTPTRSPSPTPTRSPSPTPTRSPSPTPTIAPTAICYNIKAYDTNWTQLTNTQLAQLKPGNVVRFTVQGQASTGNFTKARFTINGTTRPEVTAKKSGTNEFYDEYTIPSNGTTNFTIGGEVYHESLGWR